MSKGTDQKDIELKILEEGNSNKNSKEFTNRKVYLTQTVKNKKKYEYPNNFVRTSKYTILDFFPKSLLFQFLRLANCYFLLICIIQNIPAISTISGTTASAPLIIVLLISILREGVEDYFRHVSDQKENTEKVKKFNGVEFVNDLSSNLEVGDLVRIDEFDIIPADILLLSCSNLTKIAYIETANLDGEKNLKPKYCIPQIFNYFKDGDNVLRIRGQIICDIPNSDIQKFNGRLKLSKLSEFSVSVKQLLYKGTILKNTKWAVGVVVYSGCETKIVMNSLNQSYKSSHLERLINYLLGLIFLIQLVLCIIAACLCTYWKSTKVNLFSQFIYFNDTQSIYLSGFISFWYYLQLLNTMIPISLVVSIEMVKYAQGMFMNSDVLMYSKVKEKYMKVNSCSLNEELGQIKYIFSDKTGTLTANKLEFKICAIGNYLYGCSDSYLEDSGSRKLERKVTAKSGGRGLNFEFTFPEHLIKRYIANQENGESYTEIKIFSASKHNHITINNQKDLVEHFLYLLTLNQTCFIDKDSKKKKDKNSNKKISSEEERLKGGDDTKEDDDQSVQSISYKGDNPDEIILTDAARHLGMVYVGGDDTVYKLKILRETSHTSHYYENKNVEIFKILEFSSARKMMSVIVRLNDKFILYSKGADTKIQELLAQDQPFYDTIKFKATKLSEKGLRVLWLGLKVIDQSYFNEWNYNFEQDLKDKTSEDAINLCRQKHYRLIENGLTLFACTAVEDKLQEEVPEVIKELQQAGINVWVLTGDNLPTAKNIGLMCNLLPTNMDIYEINSDIEKFKETINKFVGSNHFTKENIDKSLDLIEKFESDKKEAYLLFDKNDLERKAIFHTGLEKMLQKYLKSEKENASVLRGVLIEADVLKLVLPQDDFLDIKYYAHPLSKIFLDLSLNSQAVICCRVSPKQKALVVRMVKKNVVGSITLSVGDGANDVSMITEADVGVGLFGEEGTQAAMASDYACGDFKCLRRLILFHGRLNYLRIAEMILYFFFKNFLFTIPHFFFAFYCGYSGLTMYDDWYLSLYNLLFTSTPLIIKALFERDIVDPDEKSNLTRDENFLAKAIPFTFYVGRESTVFNLKNFTIHLTFSLCYSVMIYFCQLYYLFNCVSNIGDVGDFWMISITQFTTFIFIANFRLMITQRHWTILNFIMILVFSFGLYYSYNVFSYYFEYSNSQATFYNILHFPQYYLSIFIMVGVQIVVDLAIYYFQFDFNENPVNLLRKYEEDKPDLSQEELDNEKKECKDKIQKYDELTRNSYKVERVQLN